MLLRLVARTPLTFVLAFTLLFLYEGLSNS